MKPLDDEVWISNLKKFDFGYFYIVNINLPRNFELSQLRISY